MVSKISFLAFDLKSLTTSHSQNSTMNFVTCNLVTEIKPCTDLNFNNFNNRYSFYLLPSPYTLHGKIENCDTWLHKSVLWSKQNIPENLTLLELGYNNEFYNYLIKIEKKYAC